MGTEFPFEKNERALEAEGTGGLKSLNQTPTSGNDDNFYDTSI